MVFPVPPSYGCEQPEMDFVAKDSPEYWDGRSEILPQRTVRRKKSSFDLRDVFKKGAVVVHKSML